MIHAKAETPIQSSRVWVLSFVLAALVAAGLTATAKPAHARDFTVSNTNDSGAGSLRQAITDANATSEADVVKFNIPGSGVKTIKPSSELPRITEPVTIDGYTQPGSKKNSLTKGTDAMLLIELDGTNAGTGAVDGLTIDATNVVVRGLVINRFSFNGIQTLRPIFFRDATNVKIEGNFIGTDASGTQDRGNGNTGVGVFFGQNDTIGGASPEARNLISGNGRNGIVLNGNTTDANKVEGNLIGTKKDGASGLGNDDAGVLIFSGSNTVGGATPGAANTIAFNGGDGVGVGDLFANRVLGNSIFSNGEQGIDLGDDGPTPNDARDGDTGPNFLQNFPVLSSAKKASGKTTVKGTLNSTPNQTYTVRFYSNPAGEDEGKRFLGKKSATTDGAGNASFSFVAPSGADAGNLLTAAATDKDGNTSEISEPVEVKQQAKKKKK
jgi:hypothetical protein